jgi:O-antigen/teichoic acid export membrane protein
MPDTNTNTKTIARNTGWFSIENILNAVVALITSIAINRYLGPDRNSYIIFVSQIAAMVSGFAGFGIPATTRKYMAEFIGMGDRGTAKFIYWRTLAIQTVLATLAAGSLLFWVMKSATGDYKLASALIVLSIWPAMVNSVSSQANSAAEDFFSNVPASIFSALTYFTLIFITIYFNWGVVGVGKALLCMRAVDFLVRFFPTMKRVLEWKTTQIHPPGLIHRMLPFAWQNLVSTAVAMVVWGRSEVLLLEYFNADKNQVSYYSVAFTMAELLLLVATIFGSAAGATIFAQYGRDKSKLPELAGSTFRYIALMSIPLHLIAASLAAPALLVVYGHKFVGAMMVVALAPLLCLFKAFLMPAQNLLESMEQQRFVIGATAFAGVIDIGVAWYLIPLHGAVGACLGNGAGQLMAVGIMWAICVRLYHVKLPWKLVAKLVFISILASLTAHHIAVRLSPLWAVLCGGSAALIVLFTLFYSLRVLEPEDHRRIKQLTGMMPQPISHFADGILALLIRPRQAEAIPVDASSFQSREDASIVSTKDTPLVLLIAYHFPPDNEIGAARPYRFYKYLKKLGYECHVITAAPQESENADVEYVEDSLRSEVHAGTAWQMERIVRRFLYSRGLKLQWAALAFQAGMLFLKKRKSENIVILSTSPPVSTHIAALLIAAKTGRKWISDFRDPIYFSSGYSGPVQRFIAANLSRLVLDRSNLALANTDTMHRLWHKRFPRFGGKTHILWNGFDPDDVIRTYILPQRQCKILSHIGELYGGRDIRPILNAFVRLFDSGKLAKESVFIRQVGIVAQSEQPAQEFLETATSEGWLEMREPVPANEARSIALDSDGLLLIQPQSDVQVPGKLFEYLRLGRPILAYVIRNSPSERILRQAGVPFECIFPDHALEEVEQRILRFLAMLDGQLTTYSPWFAETFDASRQVKVLDALIRSLSV